MINTSLMRGPVASYGIFGVRALALCASRPASELTAGLPLAQKIANATQRYFLMSPEDGAKTQIYLAASPEVDEKDYRCARVPARSCWTGG